MLMMLALRFCNRCLIAAEEVANARDAGFEVV